MKTMILMMLLVLGACGSPAGDGGGQDAVGDGAGQEILLDTLPETLADTALDTLDTTADTAPDTLDTVDGGLPDGVLCTPQFCDDHNPCTDDLCLPLSGCAYSPNTLPCDDGQVCTTFDTCAEGLCLGTAVPGCDDVDCGDGVCSESENCGSCPLDCNPLGGGTCAGTCDPTASPSSCNAGFACTPIMDGDLFLEPVLNGNGWCAYPCEGDGDCDGGTCVAVEGLSSKGICADTCQEDQPGACGPTHTCVPMAGGLGLGFCLPGPACPKTSDPTCQCAKVAGLTSKGFCASGCHVGKADVCPAAVGQCVTLSALQYHQGLCVGSSQSCDPLVLESCGGNTVCRPVGGPGFSGGALVCLPFGTLEEGSPCDAENFNACGPGLLCHQGGCLDLCHPSTSTCLTGSCLDLSASYGLAADSVGVCTTFCGDGSCGDSEGCLTCPADCGICQGGCGDGTCALDEGCEVCPADCGPCEFCGDGTCGEGEDCDLCPDDCKDCARCGDDVCTAQLETCVSCEADCGACPTTCGDDLCAPSENCLSCADDCGACTAECGDKLCGFTERCWTCEADCGPCAWTCGDGTCNDNEDCATCPQDCALLGVPGCAGDCDPTLGKDTCGGARVCVPFYLQRLFTAPFQQGNGVCGVGCLEDGDCPEGKTCLHLAGTEAAGICGSGLACDPLGEGCADPMTACVPLPAPAEGSGMCLPGCFAQSPASCAGGTCLPRNDPPWHAGTCVGQDTACDALTQNGCSEGKTCLAVGGSALGGAAQMCATAGAVAAGSKCSPKAPCAKGLVCHEGTCTSYCKPGQGGTCSGQTACEDQSANLGLAPATLGVCVLPAS